MAENNATKERLYVVKEVRKFSELDRNRIYYWSQKLKMVKPDMVVYGHQIFNLRALLYFRLIAEMLELGLRPEFIQKTVWGGKLSDVRIWDEFIANKLRYEQGGFYFFSSEREETFPGDDSPYIFAQSKIGTAKDVQDSLFPYSATDIEQKNIVVINLLKIIRDIEEKTGEKLE